jgi:hypothetical protein
MDFVKDMNHRMDLVELTDKEMLRNNKDLDENISALNMKTALELEDLKNECKTMLDDCKFLHRAIYKLGSSLKEKVQLAKLEELKKNIDEWKIEDFATRKDLISSFERYSR